ncbi:hypothetical protein, partial [Streptomyces rhizosphaericus]|uniref:hypothetical protein n=2 Tax=Streptomyces TaxID=1883 RepID=UPI0031E2C612
AQTDVITGERNAGKLARSVREGAVGKGPEPRAPRRRPTSLFERAEDGQYTVSTWSGDSLDGLGGSLADTILANRGIHCVGEQTRAVLAPLGMQVQGTVPAPASHRAAFAHTVRGHGEGTFTRATCALLC